MSKDIVFNQWFARFKELDSKNRLTNEEEIELDDLRDSIYNALEDALENNKISVTLEDNPSEMYYLQAEAVVKIGDNFYKFPFCFNSWVDDGGFGDFSTLDELKEVFPVQKVVTVYE